MSRAEMAIGPKCLNTLRLVVAFHNVNTEDSEICA